VLTLYGPDGTTLLRSADGGGPGGAEQIVWTAPTSGTYLIRASELAGSGGCVAYGYDLRVTAQADLPVAQDTFIHQNSDQNFGASTDLSLDGRSGRQDRVLVEFDVSGIPAGAAVESAILNLNLRSAKTSTPISVAAHRLTRAWTESGAGWNLADGSTNWTTPGGDYDPTALSTATEAATLGWYGWEVTAAAQAWRSGAPNHGLILRATTSTQFNNEKLHQSREATTNRPFLRVVYSDP
jgi:hypothetical protein